MASRGVLHSLRFVWIIDLATSYEISRYLDKSQEINIQQVNMPLHVNIDTVPPWDGEPKVTVVKPCTKLSNDISRVGHFNCKHPELASQPAPRSRHLTSQDETKHQRPRRHPPHKDPVQVRTCKRKRKRRRSTPLHTSHNQQHCHVPLYVLVPLSHPMRRFSVQALSLSPPLIPPAAAGPASRPAGTHFHLHFGMLTPSTTHCSFVRRMSRGHGSG